MLKSTPIIEEIKTPISAISLFRHLKDRPYLSFLDSGMDSQKLGRYSFLSYDPFLVLKSKNGTVDLMHTSGKKETIRANPFYVIKDIMNVYALGGNNASLPFTGGAIGYLSYDLCRHIEDIPSTAIDDIDLPDCFLSFYDTAIIFDHLKEKVYISSTGFPETDNDARLDRANKRLAAIKGDIKKAFTTRYDTAQAYDDMGYAEAHIESNFSRAEYIEAVNKAKEYISKGDIYQVNLSQRFSSQLFTDPAKLFERLRSINPAPFSAYLDIKDAQIVSASPERFLCKRDRKIHTRPIKGTRPRGVDKLEDGRYRIELLKSAKDMAEHIMIVDLERNDLGRVCEYGSVIPTELAILEAYSTVFHLTSTINGTLKDGAGPVDALIKCFPGGSITGAPKIRSMEIIDELEPTGRSVYTGSIGYIDFNGNMDTSIVIRTFIIKDRKAYFQFGGGIVADSDPAMEYRETLDKAKALFQSLGIKEGRYVSI